MLTPSNSASATSSHGPPVSAQSNSVFSMAQVKSPSASVTLRRCARPLQQQVLSARPAPDCTLHGQCPFPEATGREAPSAAPALRKVSGGEGDKACGCWGNGAVDPTGPAQTTRRETCASARPAVALTHGCTRSPREGGASLLTPGARMSHRLHLRRAWRDRF